MSHAHITIDGHSLASLNHRFGDDPHALFLAETHLGEHYRASHDGELPHTLFWDWLEARHDLNPARFDHWHPRIGRWIEESRQVLPVGTQGVSCSPVVGVSPVHSSAAPEPAGWLLLALGLIGVLLFQVGRPDKK